MKGYIQTLEAFIAAVIILSAMIYIFSSMSSPPQISLYSTAHDCLKYLDENGKLRYYAYNNQEDSLKNDLRSCLPGLADFEVKICKTADCGYQAPENKTVALASYLISGDVEFQSTLINLWVWSK